MRLCRTAHVVTLPVLYTHMFVYVHIHNGVGQLCDLVHITLNVFVTLICGTHSNNYTRNPLR